MKPRDSSRLRFFSSAAALAVALQHASLELLARYARVLGRCKCGSVQSSDELRAEDGKWTGEGVQSFTGLEMMV